MILFIQEADFVNTFNYDNQYIYFIFNENQLYETSSDTIKSRVCLFKIIKIIYLVIILILESFKNLSNLHKR
jgi:hypothetical protein